MRYKQAREYARHHRSNQTPAESFFGKKLERKDFFGKKFLRQFIVEYQEILNKQYFYIVDFYCAEKRLVIEIDGSIHLNRKEVDKGRQDVLEKMGFKVIRFTNEEVLNNWDEVSVKLKAALEI